MKSFEKADKIVDYFKDNDPIYERAAKFERGIKDLFNLIR
jgi:hypothetical protein